MTQDEALSILKTGGNVFLTGEPGSGKTHTVNTYVAWLRKYGIEPAITASTGIAATHIGGMTIHSWSGIGIKRGLSEYDVDQIAQQERTVKRIRSTHVLIIDEISMLDARMLTDLNAVCKAVKGSGMPFGGLQVVFVGDFFQLPPVVSRVRDTDENQELFERVRDKAQFAFTAHAWSEARPLVCYLSEQHRTEDPVFLELLSALRRGEITEDHKDILSGRATTAAPAAAGAAVTKLFSHNADVDRINEHELRKLPGKEHRFSMHSRGPEKLLVTLKKNCLSPEMLVLKEGARVMFTKNNYEGKFVNGTTGIVSGFSEMSGYPIIKTTNGRVIEAEPMDWNIETDGKVLAGVTQLPLRLAWAITVHKSQGMSLDAAFMDLSGAFEYGQGYVALSRVRTLSGLHLGGINERALEVHPDVAAADATFRELSDAATEAFEKMEKKDLTKLHEQFVTASGGRRAAAGTSTKSKKSGEPTTAYQERLAKLRETHPNAYMPWKAEDDAQLVGAFKKNSSIPHLSKHMGRQEGSIYARLVKLGLVEDEYHVVEDVQE